MQAHAAGMALLAVDLADIPADRLERAVHEWVRTEKWLPKASELIAICQRHQRNEFDPGYHPATERASADAFADSRNAGMNVENGRKDIEWFTDEAGQPRLRYKLDEDQLSWKRDRVRPTEVPRLNAGLRRYGSMLRFTGSGYPFDLQSDEIDPAPATYPWNGGKAVSTAAADSGGGRLARSDHGRRQAPRSPTRADYVAMGVDPTVLDQPAPRGAT